MHLAKTPAILEFDDIEKGYFPHKFNTRSNKFYRGPYPDPSYYGYDTMTYSKRVTFMQRCIAVCHQVLDFQKELHRYSVNNVEGMHSLLLNNSQVHWLRPLPMYNTGIILCGHLHNKFLA